MTWRYHVEWRPLPAAEATPAGRWLVLEPGTAGWAAGWAAALGAAGARVVRVPAGAGRAELAELFFGTAGDSGFEGVVSLLAAHSGPDPREPAVPAGVAATLTLVQAMADTGVTAPLWCLTRGAVSTGAADPVREPGQAAVWGLGFVAGLEQPELWGGLVDVPAAAGPAELARLWAVLAGAEDQVAIRPGGVFGRRVARAPGIAAGGSWRPAGTALVAGGQGALGRHVAGWLAESGCEHVVLASRDAVAGEFEAGLAALGTKVDVERCDLADRDSVAALAERLRAAGTRPRVVFHCAGAAEMTGVRDQTVGAFAATGAAKTAGAAHLAEFFGPGSENFVMFACFPGVWGSYGRAASVAADAHLDAFARYLRSTGVPATTVAWGAWAAGGTLADPKVVEQLRRGGVRPLPPRAALDTLAAQLAAGVTAELVIDLDWPTFAAVFTARRPSPLLDAIAREPVRPVAELPEADRRQALADLTRIEVAAVLGLSRPDLVALTEPLAAQGLDAERAEVLRERLSRRAAAEFPADAVAGTDTPAELAARLTALLGD
ncbi:beta-ketoacyl reductase [Amycolatopsis sp. NPDC003865]